MSLIDSPRTVVPSIEGSDDIDFDLGNGEDLLLAEVLDKVEQGRKTPRQDPFEDYETHRRLEDSLSPQPERSTPLAQRSLEAAAIEIVYDDLLDETFTRTYEPCRPRWRY